MPTPGADAFDAFYYRHCCGHPYARTPEWLDRFDAIAERIVTDLAPRRVLDAGCAWGFLVEALRKRGVEAWGVDLSPYAIDQVDPSVRPYCRVGSITDDLDGDYDLIVCIEVVEHMAPRDGDRAIENMCGHAPDVLFSSSPLDFQEPTHVSVRPPEAWAEVFARAGAFRDVDFDAAFVLPWAVRFRRRQEPVHRLVREYERRYWYLQHAADEARLYAARVQGELGGLEHERGDWAHRLHVAHVEHHETAQRVREVEATLRGEVATALTRAEQAESTVAQLQQDTAQRAEVEATLRRELAAVLSRAEQSESSVARLEHDSARRAQGEATLRAELAAALSRAEQSASTVAQLQAEVAQARHHLVMLKRSRFWQARAVIKRLLGQPAD